MVATTPPPLVHVCSKVKIYLVFLKHYRKTVFDPRQEKNFFLYIKYREQSFNEKTCCKNNRTAPMLKNRKFHSWFWLHDSLFSRVCLLIHLLRQKKYSLGLIPKHIVSTSTWKSPLQLKEWFCVVNLNLEKMKLMMQTHLLFMILHVLTFLSRLPFIHFNISLCLSCLKYTASVCLYTIKYKDSTCSQKPALFCYRYVNSLLIQLSS